MTSIFGGEQTVPQTQFTNQNYSQTQNAVQNQNQTQAQTYAANPTAQQMGANIYDFSHAIMRGDWGGPPGLNVADLTGQQHAGIDALTNQGYWTGSALVPAGQAAMTSATQAITPNDINSFLNPYQDYITANLQDIFGQQNLANRMQGTTATGGTGADRSAVGQALLAKQQGLAAGQTYAGIYQSALQAAQQQKAQQLQAGQAAVQGGFGAWGQGLQAASIPQAQQQAVNQARYQQLLGAYQDPYMRLSALTSALPGVAGLGGTGASIGTGSATTQAGTTGAQTGLGNASTTYPAPSPISQIAGLGSLALGAGMLFGGSDRREKTDIQKFGNKDKNTGLQPYAFRYKGDPKTYPKVVGYMAQDVKKKLPHAVKEFARGGGIQRFQYGGEEDSGRQQDSNYLTGFTDVNTGGSDAPEPPYAEQQGTWDPKRIFSPDRLQKAQRAIALAQKASQQSQIARPRVSPITFPQVPWKSGITFARGGRLAINLPALNRAIAGQQEGGRVDAATADSWGGYKVWRPGMRNYARDYDWGEGITENAPPQGRPFTAQPQTQDQWGPGQNENQARNRLLWDRMLETREPWRGARGRNVNPNARIEGVYRLGGSVRGYDDGGSVDDETRARGYWKLKNRMGGDIPWYKRTDLGIPQGGSALARAEQENEMNRTYKQVRGYDDGGFVDPLAGMDPMPESEPEPPGLPEYEDGDTGEDISVIPVPRPRPPGAGQGIPFTPGAAPAAGGPSLFGKPVSPGAMALIQAGLGMLAASGQRDARGLPMSGLAAIGKGGAMGMDTYQSMQNQQQKDLLAQQGMRLREQTLAQNLTRQNADLALRQQAQADLERHRANLLAQRSGEDRPFTVKGPYGDRTVIKKPDGTYEEIKPSKPQPGVIEPPEEKTGTAAFDPSGGPTPPVSDDEKDTAARVMTEGGFKSPLKVDPELLDAMQTSPEQFDFNAARLALGDTSVLQGYGNRQAAVAYRNALKSRAAQYWLDRGLTANDANAAVAEFGAMKAGARTLAQQEARITGALEKAASVAPVVKDLSKQVSRTNYPALNKVIVAAKEQTGDPTVIKYGIAIETLITEYGSALGQGNSVLTDHQSKRAENILKKAYSEGQMDAAVDQLLVEIDRVKAGVRKGMGTYLGKRESSPFAPVTKSQADEAMDWIKANPNDPRVPAIKKKLGIP